MADNLSPSSAHVMEYGSVNLPDPSGTHRPVMGLLYLFIYVNIYVFNISCAFGWNKKKRLTARMYGVESLKIMERNVCQQ
jgi:hypothetical protein